MRWTRGFALTALTAALLLAAPSAGTAGGYGWKYDYGSNGTLVNVAKEWNGTDGLLKGNLALAVQYSDKARTRIINNVVASGACHGCGTVALGFQIVFLNHPNPKVYAQNKAFAFNTNCVECLTVALAFQFVVLSPFPFHLSPQTQAGLAGVAAELDRLRNSALPAPTIEALVGQKASEVQSLLAAATAQPLTIDVNRYADLSAR